MLTCLLYTHSRLLAFLQWCTKELALPPSFCSFLTPKVLVPSFPLFTSYIWTVVLFFCSVFIFRHPPLLLLPAPKFILLFCLYSPHDTLGEKGLGTVGWLPTIPHQGRWGSAPWMLQESEGGILMGKGCRTTFYPCSWGRVGQYLYRPGLPL